MSTGEKTLMSKVLYLYFQDIKNKIILIDEPELSLHPAWQNRVLKLYENFAKENNSQIIIATHSPHIIGSAKNEWVRVLTEDGAIDNFSQSYGLEFSKVLTDIMGVNNLRTPDIEKDFKYIKQEIYSNNYRNNPKFETIWKHLEENLESNDIDLNSLRDDFELMKKMIFSYKNIDKEEFKKAWDRLEKKLGKSDLDLKLLRLEMKMRDR
jgi:predicted ATP-binding protein involved in virulence